MKIVSGIVFGLLLIIYSCTSTIDVDMSGVKNKMTLNCTLTADSIISLRLNSSAFLTKDPTNGSASEELFPPIENALVQIYENSTLLSVLTYKGEGMYMDSLHTVKAGSIYKITAEANGFPSIEASDTVPNDLTITDKSFTPSQYAPNYEGDCYYSFNVLNPNKEKRYYSSEIWIKRIKRYYTDSVNYHLYVDWNYNYAITFSFAPESILLGYNNLDIYLFPNKGFSSETETFTVPFRILSNSFAEAEEFAEIYEFGIYSPCYYRYAESYSKSFTDDNFFVEPSPMYSNVKGGVGILMSRNLYRDTLVYYHH